jgi:hypothetical protein
VVIEIDSDDTLGGAGMQRVRSLRFEIMEERLLQSGAGQATLPAAPVPAASLRLDGTLTVRYASHLSFRMNTDGSKTRSIPVGGQLGALGRVHGIWNESQDTFGNYDGPDKLVVGNSQGSIEVTFFNQNSPRGVGRLATSAQYVHTQHVFSGTGAYAGASESGTIVLTTSAVSPRVIRITLQSTGT